ncbi:MAG: ABC transporter substrate-binding protein [Candidatus Desulfatibia sp.]|uniref:ABC transporter substrate-binding protein n=1 Tax=Candidatus Desulfatibia sp. TaxID=3101189 RepID=UPI002F319FDB
MSSLKKLELLFTEGKISRREFLARVSALGLMAAVSPMLLSTPAHAAKPKKGGRFRIGLAGAATTDSLDPATLPDITPQMINTQIRNRLVEVDYKSNPIPELAESWESSPDAVKWIFKLRQGVEFHNGKTMEAADVIESFNHHRGKDSKSAAKGVVDPIKEIKADGKHTVIFTLQEGNADFPYVASDYHLTIQPAGTKDFQKGMGTGAYILESFEPGVRTFAKRNPNYFKKGRAHFDEIETIGINDANARTNALKTGQVDAINRCERKTVKLLEKIPGIKVIKSNGTKHYTIPMITTMKPFDNNDVRLALKYAVDREQLVKTVLRGYGYVGNDHPIGRNQRFFASELPQRKFDPDKAKYYLKKAGLAGYTFKLHTSDAAFGGAVDAAVLYKEQAAKAGIKIDVVKEPKDGYWSNVWMKKAWTFSFWSGRVTEDWMFSIAFAAGAGWNDTFWKHEKFNKLLKAARAELDNKKRREMYVEMQSIVRDQGAVVIPMFAADLTGVSTKLGYENVGADWEMDGMRAPERWWFI